MCGIQSFIAVHETARLVKFIGKGCPIFFASVYVTLLSTTGYKVLKVFIPDSYGLPDRTTTEQTYTISGLY